MHIDIIKGEEVTEKIMYAALTRGLSFKTMSSTIALCPPMVVTQTEMQAALDILEECFTLFE